MAIVDEDVERVRQVSDLVDVVSKHVALRQVGRRWTGLCPFHAEKHALVLGERRRGPLLLLRLPGQGRRHHASCVTIEHLDFVGAVEWLAGTERHHAALHDRGGGQGAAAPQAARRGDEARRRLVPRASALGARRGARTRLPAVAGLRRRRRAALQARVGHPTSGMLWPRACSFPTRCSGTPGSASSTVANRQQDSFRGSRAVPDLRRAGRPGGLRRSHPAGRRGSQVQELVGHPDLREEPGAVRARTGRSRRSSRPTRSSCARDTPTSSASIGWACPEPSPPAAPRSTEDHLPQLARFARRIVLAFDADAAGQNAADRVYEWERPIRPRRLGRRAAAGLGPGRPGPHRPGRAAGRGRERGAVPRLPRRPRARGRAAHDAGGPRPGRRGRARGDRRASQRARARPVRDAGRRRAAASIPIGSAASSHTRRARGASRSPPAATRRTPETAEAVALKLLMHRWDETAPYLSRCCSPTGSRSTHFARSVRRRVCRTRSTSRAPRLRICSRDSTKKPTRPRRSTLGRDRASDRERAPSARLAAMLAGPDRPSDVSDVRRLIDEVREQMRDRTRPRSC